MSLLGCLRFWSPIHFPELICPRYDPGLSFYYKKGLVKVQEKLQKPQPTDCNLLIVQDL